MKRLFHSLTVSPMSQGSFSLMTHLHWNCWSFKFPSRRQITLLTLPTSNKILRAFLLKKKNFFEFIFSRVSVWCSIFQGACCTTHRLYVGVYVSSSSTSPLSSLSFSLLAGGFEKQSAFLGYIRSSRLDLLWFVFQQNSSSIFTCPYVTNVVHTLEGEVKDRTEEEGIT